MFKDRSMTKPPPPPVDSSLQAPPNDAGNLRPRADEAIVQPPLIVGIGASAGGLEAFRTFFSHMPADEGFAFVLIQHLSPEHVSALADIVSRSTSMVVTEASDGERVLAGHVYVIPPDATLTISDSTLKVSRPAPPRPDRWPINTFFTSLADLIIQLGPLRP